MLGYVVLCRFMSYLCGVMLCLLCCVMLEFNYTILYHVVVSCCVVLCCVVLCFRLCCVVLCCALFYHVSCALMCTSSFSTHPMPPIFTIPGILLHPTGVSPSVFTSPHPGNNTVEQEGQCHSPAGGAIAPGSVVQKRTPLGLKNQAIHEIVYDSI